MRFEQTLQESIYPPWREHYIEYSKLKKLLREDRYDESEWTEEDESKFCEEILNTQLDRVASFQESTFQKLESRAAVVGDKLRDLVPDDTTVKGDITKGRFKELEKELDSITNDTNELKKFCSINYTGFLKIVKKHDRKRGGRYKVRPMLQINLSKRPFNSEAAYIPLLNRISAYYFLCHQNLDDEQGAARSDAQSESDGDRYTAYKFWIHPENLVEVRTYILRRLPILVYSNSSAKQADAGQGDPSITSLYFDNAKFKLYGTKVNSDKEQSSLRIRWEGPMKEKQTFTLEKKIVHDNGSSEDSRISIKEKYIQQFIKREYSMEKSVQKLERQHMPKAKVDDFKKTSSNIQNFILENDLQPVLRANYTRSAFQKPLDDRVRISIDTNLTFIREDSLDSSRPCRNPDSWHRLDIDNASSENPFANVNTGEISKFPFAVLEIKVREEGGKKSPQWVQDLMASHLVHKAPRFSKFVQGVAVLFDDYVNNLPFWLSELDSDIRKDPHEAFAEEEQAKAQKAADELMVGSYLGKSKGVSYKPAVSSPLGNSYMTERLAAENNGKSRAMSDAEPNGKSNGDGPNEGGSYGTMASVFPSFSLSRYAQARRQRDVKLPPGVTKPSQLIKDSGPLRVEPKVWLANERTFLKWQHICILLGGLAVGLYTAAGEDDLAEFMGIAYIVIAIFAGLWGYYMHFTRRNMIIARSGKDFDNLIGPMVVSAALMVALLLNFVFKVCSAV